MYGTALPIKCIALKGTELTQNYCQLIISLTKTIILIIASIPSLLFNVRKRQSEKETTVNCDPPNKLERTSFRAAGKV